MRINKRLVALSFVALLHVCLSLAVLPRATAQDVEIVAAELGGISVVSIPQPSPLPGLLATRVVLRWPPESQLVTFEHVSITGAVHQVWFPELFGPTSTPFVDGDGWDVLPVEWIAADSHMLISRSMVGGQAGIGFGSIYEVNDLSNPVMANESLPFLDGQFPAVTGIGDIALDNDNFAAFFVQPEFQLDEIEWGYLVTLDDGTADDNVSLTVGVLGAGIINSDQPGGAAFGFKGNDPVVIPFIPEPTARVLAMSVVVAFACLRRRTRGTHRARTINAARMAVAATRAEQRPITQEWLRMPTLSNVLFSSEGSIVQPQLQPSSRPQPVLISR